MNQDTDKAGPFTIKQVRDTDGNKHRAAVAHGAIAGCDFRARTPADMAEQLERDVASLEITGASFAKDEAFYKTVAANLREAAVKLATWQQAVDELEAKRTTQVQGAKVSALSDCLHVVACMNDAVPAADGACSVWRRACAAISGAINARFQSEIGR